MKMTPRNILLSVATVGLLALITLLDTTQQTTPLYAAPEVTPLDRVPADAALFAHFRADKLWDHPLVADIRKAAPKELGAFFADAEKSVGIGPMDLDTLTFFYPKFPENGADGMLFVVQVTTKKPHDKNKILTELRVKKDPVQKDGTVKLQEALVLVFTGDKQFSVMHESLVADFMKGATKTSDGPITDAIKAAREGKSNLVLGVNPETLPAELFANAPPEIQPFLPLLKSKSITFKAALADQLKAEIRFHSDTADKTIENERAFNLLVKLATDGIEDLLKEEKGSKEAQAFSPLLKGLLESLKQVKANRDGNMISASVAFKADAAMAKPILQFFLKPQQAAARTQSSNNLKQLGLALHNYADSNKGVFPAASICDKKGKPLLSWRVAILPYIEQNALYKQFKLDEPWDSDHNKKLAETIVKIYQMPGGDAKPGYTNYRVFVGPDTAFDYVQGRRMPADFPDGTSNTLLVFEAAEAVLWTKPDEIDFDPKKPIKPHLRFREDSVVMMLLADGSVRAVSKSVSEETLSRLITRNDGNAIGNDLD